MEKTNEKKPLYLILILVSLLATVAMLLTLLPWPSARWDNVLGYKSLCLFTPAATLFCAFIAGLSCFLRATFVKEQVGSGGERFKKHIKTLIPLILIFSLALASSIWYIRVDSRYPEGITSATMSE